MEITQQRIARVIFEPPHVSVPFRKAAVLGAGTMGGQIAAHLANAGVEVYLLDIPAKGGSDPNAVVEKAFKDLQRARPNPFFSENAAQRITTGNLENDFDKIGEVEWIIEAVVEKLEVKRSLMERVERVAGHDAIISSNTSGLPISAIASGRSEEFRRRFLGTHFFNPPRYAKLLELVPSTDTDDEVVRRIAHFGRIHLGKGIVIARDTPYFIGNRIGVYAMLQAMRKFTEGEYSIEEVDTLTGPLTGRPKSATFRTADIVGLDVMKDVADNLYEAAEGDENRDAFRVPDLLDRLVARGSFGQKTGEGFYRKEGKTIKSVDADSMDYLEPSEQQLENLDAIRGGDLTSRLQTLFHDEGRAGAFFRETTLDLLVYSAWRIPEITDDPADLDRAIRWGFGWEMGPFEIWDVLGFDEVERAMEAEGLNLPEWIVAMRQSGFTSFYREAEEGRSVYSPARGRYVEDPEPVDHVDVSRLSNWDASELWSSDDAALIDIGEGVVLYEFRSKANTLGRAVMDGLRSAIERVESDRSIKGLVVANEGKNFSAGANLAELASALEDENATSVLDYLKEFQETIQRVRYARKPVVVAVHQLALGGACELVMACQHPVAAAESYIGLVELGVGLIPAGTGTMRLAAIASTGAPTSHPSHIQPWLQKFFEAVARSEVSTSAEEAQKLGYISPHARIVMNADRRIFVAREEVLRLSHEGYRPPQTSLITVLGRPTAAALRVVVQQYLEGRFISEYDAFLANQFAYVLTGGELPGARQVSEEYLLDLEREVFVDLLQQRRTRDRIQHMLATKKPLRN